MTVNHWLCAQCAIWFLSCHSGTFDVVEYDPSNLPDRDVEVPPGRYNLLLAATSGTCAGESIRGTLILHPTRDTDRSPRTGEGPVSRRESNLWGFTDAPFHRFCAAVETSEQYSGPGSEDPIFPGVLGEFSRVDGFRRQVLLVGTFANRGRVLFTDGSGIALKIERVTETSFRGVWTPYGIAMNGTGTWEARPQDRDE
jgi:hypothetical protein